MKRSLKAYAFLGIASALLSQPARAEVSAVGADFNSVFTIIENLILGGKIDLNPIQLGACTPTVGLGIPSVKLFFAKSTLCPISGQVSFSLVPLKASVDLDVFNSAVVEHIAMDVDFTLKLSGGYTYTSMVFSNGNLVVRPIPGGAAETWTITGKGTRQEGKGMIDGKTRINLFNVASRNGFAMLKTVSKASASAPKVKNVQLCSLSGADPGQYLVGQLDACKVLIDKK